MTTMVDIDLHGKRHSDFELMRIMRAAAQGFAEPVTAYLTGVVSVLFLVTLERMGTDALKMGTSSVLLRCEKSSVKGGTG